MNDQTVQLKVKTLNYFPFISYQSYKIHLLNLVDVKKTINQYIAPKQTINFALLVLVPILPCNLDYQSLVVPIRHPFHRPNLLVSKHLDLECVLACPNLLVSYHLDRQWLAKRIHIVKHLVHKYLVRTSVNMGSRRACPFDPMSSRRFSSNHHHNQYFVHASLRIGQPVVDKMVMIAVTKTRKRTWIVNATRSSVEDSVVIKKRLFIHRLSVAEFLLKLNLSEYCFSHGKLNNRNNNQETGYKMAHPYVTRQTYGRFSLAEKILPSAVDVEILIGIENESNKTLCNILPNIES
ncbi:hypothetical protein Bhyg_09851 [Pseudolycoriella hygida]|uniref:Uncharacterized protein n=1 Tax=Pseudolycoriella hygida TaxID=35572 RepID=A0A9Q0RWU3_9DIPT|nr:hypothetical protein Bhyg_09851 [Pseudolycoriella hygida]